MFDSFHKSKQSRYLDEFVKLSNSSDSDERIDVRSNKQLKWQNCENIDEKPGLQVQQRNSLSIINDVELIILDSTEESDKDLKQKKAVDHHIHHSESIVLLGEFFKGKVKWRGKGRDEQHQTHEHVPVKLTWVVRVNHAALPLLDVVLRQFDSKYYLVVLVS